MQLTEENYWDNMSHHPVPFQDRILFDNLLSAHIRDGNGKKALEIGCVPGKWIAFISRKYGYFAEGIDYISKTYEIMEKTFENNGIKEYRIYRNDFLEWQPPYLYDLVCSFGFIEHFKHPELVFEKHVEMLRNGGQLVIEVPNFAYIQNIFHKIADSNNLARHNISIMNKQWFRRIPINPRSVKVSKSIYTNITINNHEFFCGMGI